MNQERIKRTEEAVKERLSGEGSGHDWWHIHRVRNTALYIARYEQADTEIVQYAALLHDIGDHKFFNGNEEKGRQFLQQFMQNIDFPSALINRITQIIDQISFKGGNNQHLPDSIESKIVQDADRLDAIGAIGIARTFAFGGSRNREIYNPNIAPLQQQSFETYKNSQAPTLNHFYEKLLLLKDRMHTPTAIKLAEQRHAFMESYLQQFYQEWELTDNNVTTLPESHNQ